MRLLHLLPLLLPAIVWAQTPVIGGACKIGSADVQIGGKQTQFFLKCEATSESSDGEGVWVVKSRAAAAAAPAVPIENTQPQQHPKLVHRKPANICEQDHSAREGGQCAVSATCLQANHEYPSTYLQCEQSGLRWMRKACQDGTVFNFEQQSCVIPKRVHSLSRQQASGLVCTFSSCSNSNPCSSGTCNNGYCCSSGGSQAAASPIIVSAPSSGGCIGCGAQQQAPQIIAIPAQSSCPGGGYSVGSCSQGYCATGYTCNQQSNTCCPAQAAPAIRVYTCPSGAPSVGSCNNGGCSSGYSCNQQTNTCCPSATNPFVCPDGTQAAGGCVNGQCGDGYSCANGLCCASTSNQPKCLDGSPAVGACMPSCTGNGCGGSTLTYYCGSGYTCTTGNICCPVNSCPEGGNPIGPPVNGLCPSGYTLQGNQCCSSAAGNVVDCDPMFNDPPINGQCPLIGYLPDTATGTRCCPMVDYTDPANIIGPAIAGLCPVGYTPVMIPSEPEGQCVDLQSVPGVCDKAQQIGPCVNGECGNSGYTCFALADVCCPTTAFRSRKTKKTRFGSHLMMYNDEPVAEASSTAAPSA